MIKAQELRIGNWVYSTSHKVNCKVIRLSYDSELDNSEPIPLTEDILLKCGFDNDIKPLYSLLIDDEFYVKYNIHNKGFYLVLNGFYIKRINYLHQLQNLYYALTGEELQINL